MYEKAILSFSDFGKPGQRYNESWQPVQGNWGRKATKPNWGTGEFVPLLQGNRAKNGNKRQQSQIGGLANPRHFSLTIIIPLSKSGCPAVLA
ncbi:hypothetical protein BaRGS_00002579 [Batillaria attramentaria]|uniref:Uncharacterized protein n=1 Tax=Batillaria attramentaria TaxID=370345 RepID=A0ABD0M4K2_9CAEN